MQVRREQRWHGEGHAIQVRQNGGIARGQPMLGRALALVPSVAGEIDLRVRHLDELKRLVESHATYWVQMAAFVKTNNV